MTLGAISFLGQDWLWWVICLWVLTTGVLLWGYGRSLAPFRVRLTAFLLKWFGVLLIGLGLLDPHRISKRVKPGANAFAVVVDTSASLQIRDRGQEKSRGERLREALRPENAPWLGVLERDFSVRLYTVDDQVSEVSELAARPFDGERSSLLGGLRELGDRYRGRPLAGVLLFTDGNATDAGLGLSALKGMPPVYPVLTGVGDPPMDIGVRTVSATASEFEDAPVTIQAEVNAFGCSGKEVVVEVLELPASGKGGPPKSVAEQTKMAAAGAGPMVFRFQFRPSRPGLAFYEVNARLKSATSDAPTSSAPPTDEATLANNSRYAVVQRPSDNFRVLYVSGRPNWEYKFLRRALKEDDQVRMTGLVRIAKREPKFEFRGRAGESSNPLFRGFGGVENETQRYDQPVLVRLDTQDQTELAGGFPKSAEELFRYHAVIVDDLESAFFTQDQMNLLVRFVSDRGGGFLMLGGQESFREGDYGKTPIAAMLPVYLDEASNGGAPATEAQYRWGLSREGWLQPWLRLRDLEGSERERLDTLLPFQVLNQVRGLKPGASLMTDVRNGGRQFPALAVQNFGHGRAAALLVGDVWRSGMRDETAQKDLGKAWRQLVRWMVANALKPVEVSAAPRLGERGSAVELRARARKPDFEPMEEAQVALEVHSVVGGGGDQAVTSEASGDDPGVFAGSFWSSQPGAFTAQAKVTDGAGHYYGSAETGWVAEPAADEFASVAVNTALAADVARATGGRVLQMNELDRFVPTLATMAAPVQESMNEPLWHRSVWLLLAMGCFAAEWGLRRRGGMA